MLRRLLLIPVFALATFVLSTASVSADVLITYGVDEGGVLYIDLQAETANQIVLLFGTGINADGGADAMELDVQIGDGGAFIGGTDTAPTMTSIDLISGTIWESVGPTQTDTEEHPLVRQSNVDTSSLATNDGVIGAIVFDTTGFGTGEIDFLLSGVAGSFNTTLFQGTNTLTTIAPNGVIRVNPVPEPGTAGILVMGLIGIGLRRRRS